MTADHEKLMNALLVQLNLQRAGLRKRALQCLGKYAHPLLAIKVGKDLFIYFPDMFYNYQTM